MLIKDAIIFIMQLCCIGMDYDVISTIFENHSTNNDVFRHAILIRPLHPDCRVQLIDTILQIELMNNSYTCHSPLITIIDIVTETDQILLNITQQGNHLLESRGSLIDYLGIAITYQRISNLLLSQVNLNLISLN